MKKILGSGVNKIHYEEESEEKSEEESEDTTSMDWFEPMIRVKEELFHRCGFFILFFKLFFKLIFIMNIVNSRA